MVKLSPVEAKLLRLLLDGAAAGPEAEVARRKLIDSLSGHGLSGHDIAEMLEHPQELLPEPPPQMSKPDYGLCRMPFGKTKGQLFMDLPPYDLRNARRWAMSTPELARKFASFIHDVDEFLNQRS